MTSIEWLCEGVEDFYATVKFKKTVLSLSITCRLLQIRKTKEEGIQTVIKLSQIIIKSVSRFWQSLGWHVWDQKENFSSGRLQLRVPKFFSKFCNSRSF